MPAYQPKTRALCTCRPGIARDNCPNCEGTGQVIDFRAIRALNSHTNPYERLVSLGVPLDHHESDLYVRGTAEAVEIVKASGWSYSYFRSERTGEMGQLWIELPFAYAPWWQERLGAR